jgi:adenosine 3'-phospho 5'-phosphosulfate transporter B3
VNVVLTLVRVSGALVAVTVLRLFPNGLSPSSQIHFQVTTMRKAVTIVFSFYLFSKPFTLQYLWAGLIVLLAIYLNVYTKNRRQFDAKLAEWWRNWQGRASRKGSDRREEEKERQMLVQV